jgi:hypothetical protein
MRYSSHLKKRPKSKSTSKSGSGVSDNLGNVTGQNHQHSNVTASILIDNGKVDGGINL